MLSGIQKWFTRRQREHTLIFTLLFIGSAVGLLASFVLSVDAITIAKESNAVLSCSINAVLNCAAVAAHPTASLLGFPNPFIGMMTFPVMITIAVAGLSGVKFPRWFMVLAAIGAFGGFIFSLWMFYTSYSVIQVLCPWCLTLDASMLLIMFALARYTIYENTLRLPEHFHKKIETFSRKNYDTLILVLLFMAAILLIITKFGDALFV